LFLGCLLAQCLLVASLGVCLVAVSPMDSLPFALGVGILVYATGVLVFSSCAALRMRRG
jgi:hypothetical protein